MSQGQFGHGGHIVIVEDNQDYLHLLTRMLTMHGYTVRPEIAAGAALNTIKRNPPDLILLDILMPEMNGYEVCRELKAHDATRNIPIIFLSALDELSNKMRGFELGAVDYITKPFQLNEVLARVETHLSLQALRKSLEESNRQLQQQNQELDAFAHTVAHNLKTPLGVISAYTEILHKDAPTLDPEELRVFGKETHKAAQRASSIIEELLLLASIRKELIVMRPLNMAKIVERAKERMSIMLEEYKAEVLMPEQWPVARGYAPWIEEVWTNYLSNALKYGGRPPRLEFGADEQVDSSIRFWLRDNGDGLSAEAQKNLFIEFSRLSEIHVGGYGLGLSIARRIMDKLGGDVGVESDPGQGSLFYFILPARKKR